jgi:large subunit ribosomal protein L13
MKKAEAKKELTVDAKGRTLGRVASEIATLLMGKNSAAYKREAYSGFPVRVLNAGQIKITPKKLEQIYHTRYSGHPGGLRILKASETVKAKGFAELVKLSVYHMLPGNKLRREMMKNLKVEE